LKAIEIIADKIVDLEDLSKALKRWQLKEEKVVFTNGCFDLLHRGHIDYLSKASDLGDKLIIGLNSDHSVKMLGKGKGRPLQDQQSRGLILASLHFVSAVVLFEEETPLKLINFIRPDVLVKGSDYQIDEIAGSQEVISYGGQVTTIDFLKGFSSSLLIEKAKKLDE